MRPFKTDGGWSELTRGNRRPVRLAAADLQDARRLRARVRAGFSEVAVILDVTVAVAADFRSARVVPRSAQGFVDQREVAGGAVGPFAAQAAVGALILGPLVSAQSAGAAQIAPDTTDQVVTAPTEPTVKAFDCQGTTGSMGCGPGWFWRDGWRGWACYPC